MPRSRVPSPNRNRRESARALDQPRGHRPPGWVDSVTLNSLEPAPKDEASQPDGSLAFEFPPIPAGGSLSFYTQWQVNPTAFGRRSADVELLDGETPIARVERTATIFP